mmetsp:Transcript_7226/g.25828  ORF Transcript_7226/g.25828 Transcript_7226/m.25828 type:complete len:293 (+) Transcript_7226:983-1861(+)
MFTEQSAPAHPSAHQHTRAPTRSTHCAPFRHGYSAHSSMLNSQAAPSKPAVHMHRKASADWPVAMQLPPCWHGDSRHGLHGAVPLASSHAGSGAHSAASQLRSSSSAGHGSPPGSAAATTVRERRSVPAPAPAPHGASHSDQGDQGDTAHGAGTASTTGAQCALSSGTTLVEGRPSSRPGSANSRRDVVPSGTVAASMAPAVAWHTSVDRISDAGAVGCICSSAAAAPATCGAAMEVPVPCAVPSGDVTPALRTSTPGASTSTQGPLLLKAAWPSTTLEAPTVSAASADAGE